MKKIYYYLELIQTSPLRLGNGEMENTDNDLKTDGRGLPYIPGSSLAGVLRSGLTEPEARLLFGDIDIEASINAKENMATQSKLIISSADMKLDTDKEKVIITIRDGVGIDDWGLTINTAKYDFQVVETEQPYYAVIEWSGTEEEEQKEISGLFEPYIKKVISNGLSFGARTSRGYGAMVVSVWKKTFSFPAQLEEWLQYHPMEERFGVEGRGIKLNGLTETDENYSQIIIRFVMQDSFNLRVNTSRAEALSDGTIPDSVPLMNAKGIPVIPGTAWAGAFRHHMHRLLRECGMHDNELRNEIKRLDFECFGISSDKKINHMRSKICFSESEITGGCANTIIRNAVDRFTAAPKNTGLFTNQVWTGGKGVLQIRVASDITASDKQLLKMAIGDMGVGLLTVGGEAGIGRGMMRIIDINLDRMECSEEIVPKKFLVKKE